MAVLSSEHLCYLVPERIEALARLWADLDVRILYYVRRQDELIESAFRWHQIASAGRFPKIGPFLQKRRAAYDFEQRLAPWRRAFGDAALHLRLYHRATCAGDVVSDLEARFGLPSADLPARRDRRRASLGAAMTRVLIAYDAEHGGKESPKRQAFLDRLRHIDAEAAPAAPDLLSPAMKRAVTRDYRAANRAVADRFLTPEEAELLLAEG